ncbi:hypothetical protein V5O48_017801 [Marasmius crinis-equi]|uniref:F-box domain-containing protein n=1 Tax=Marasmius crinis-equi TaxID=585013 RepID=A0ABR3EMY2_9AGAR
MTISNSRSILRKSVQNTSPRAQESSVTDTYESRSSPITLIPNEVLLRILREYAASTRRSGHIFLEVCSAWHELASHDPRLWTFLSVDTRKFEETLSLENSKCAFEGLKATLARSKELPLDIEYKDTHAVQQAQLMTSDIEEIRRPCLSLLLQHCHRWKFVSLTLNMVSGVGGAALLRQGGLPRFPLLLELSIQNIDFPEALNTMMFPMVELHGTILAAIFQHSTQLQYLETPALPRPSGDPTFSMRIDDTAFPNVTQVVVDHTTERCLINWLELTKGSLASCDIKTMDSRFDTVSTVTPTLTGLLELPKLTSLRMPQGHTIVFDHLILPGLKTLALYDDHCRPFDISGIPEMLERSGCRLELFELLFRRAQAPLTDLQPKFPTLALKESESEEKGYQRRVYFLGAEKQR